MANIVICYLIAREIDLKTFYFPIIKYYKLHETLKSSRWTNF